MSRIAIIAARFYDELADRLVASAEDTLARDGDHEVEVFSVPGAFELPMAARLLAQMGRFDGIVLVGAVIRGETSHYEHVCTETARGIQDVQLRTGVPCGFGVITADTMEQALARAGGARRDCGANAAAAVLVLMAIKHGAVSTSSKE